MALTVSWKSFCIRPSSMAPAYARACGLGNGLLAQLLVDRVDRAVDLPAHARHRCRELRLGPDDPLRAAVGEGALGLVDLLAVAGDLADELAVQALDLRRRLDRAQVADDLVDRMLEPVERPLVLLGGARRGD